MFCPVNKAVLYAAKFFKPYTRTWQPWICNKFGSIRRGMYWLFELNVLTFWIECIDFLNLMYWLFELNVLTFWIECIDFFNWMYWIFELNYWLFELNVLTFWIECIDFFNWMYWLFELNVLTFWIEFIKYTSEKKLKYRMSVLSCR